MIEDLPEIRDQLHEHWQKAGIDLIRRGFRPQAVFDTLMTVGLAGWVELHGKESAADRLIQAAHQLSEQAKREAEAAREAVSATKN